MIGSRAVSSRRRRPTDDRPLCIQSEYDVLETVLVHQPGKEIDRLTPATKTRLLFEDVPFLDRMVREHQGFCQIMRSAGVEVLHLDALLRQVLTSDDALRDLLTSALYSSGNMGIEEVLIERLDRGELVELLFAGLTRPEYKKLTGKEPPLTDRFEEYFLILPIPNTYFMRDTTVVFREGFIPASLWSLARKREAALIHWIFEHHPRFAQQRFFLPSDQTDLEHHHLEGGDVIVLSEEALLIGCSQRTTVQGIQRIAKSLLANGHAERIYLIDIPKSRSYMHLDTIFTVLDQGKVVLYPQVFGSASSAEANRDVSIKRFEWHRGNTEVKPVDEERPFFQVLADEFALPLHELVVLETGGGQIDYVDREQLADGTNTFAIGPSEVLAYERNTHTNKALQDAGIVVHEIEGSELVRGLGGPRCMTMPLKRVT